jgi:hypothetical protein
MCSDLLSESDKNEEMKELTMSTILNIPQTYNSIAFSSFNIKE